MQNAGENDSEMTDQVHVGERDPGARGTVGVLVFGRCCDKLPCTPWRPQNTRAGVWGAGVGALCPLLQASQAAVKVLAGLELHSKAQLGQGARPGAHSLKDFFLWAVGQRPPSVPCLVGLSSMAACFLRASKGEGHLEDRRYGLCHLITE